jgi:Fic family protein
MKKLYEQIDKNKMAIDAIRPFEGNVLKQLREYYRIGLTWSSNAIEGNSLTEIETKILLEDGMTVGGKPLRDTFEAIGHSRAYDFMFTLLRERRISIDDVKMFHRLFYKGIDEENAGMWRKANVIVTGSDYRFPAPESLENQMLDVIDWIENEREKLHPVQFASALHLRFVSIHPFIDGNGRVARLLMNTALIQDGYLLAIIPPVLRNDYMSAIRTYQSRGDAELFCDFIAERVLEREKEIIRLLHITAVTERTQNLRENPKRA